jgi:membrane peptidoglycan carboxypeptidase
VLVHEDPQFFNHHGFSPLNIRNALVRDLKERRYAVGASTISMQLVKNVFLHREKTLARKIQEVLLTWWTERVMEKRDILELYLNVIEYGPSVYGIRNAAQHYWNRPPSELSPAESVFLANILPNPKHFHSYYQRNALSASWASNLRRFLQRLGERGAYDKEATDFGIEELEHFRFSRSGHAAEPRTITGSAAPLPYQQAAQAARDQMFDGGGQTNTNTVRMQPLN